MSTPAIRLTGLKKRFGASEIIRGVDLDIRPGERHAIIGPNGAGKSTLFHLISARTPVSEGAIELKGENVVGLKPFEINRKGLSRSFQITTSLSCRCSRAYAAPCCGRSAIAVPSGGAWPEQDAQLRARR
jgi:ABC-type branched-subunit amino acid transport system ATPase component